MRPLSRRVLLLTLALTALAATAVYGRYLRDLRAAGERVAGASHVAMTSCGPIEYAVAGAGPPVLIVHGAGGGFDQGLLLAAGLVQHGYRVIAISRYGYLRSPLPADVSPAAQAESYACLLDTLGLDRVAVLGASAGAPSTLQLAIRHPERVSALIVLVPAAYVPNAGGAGSEVPRGLKFVFGTVLQWDFPFWLASRVAPDMMIRTVLGTPPELLAGAGPGERQRVLAMLEAVMPVHSRRLGLLNDSQVTRTMVRFPLERIRAPTLIISARDDLYGTYERARYTAGEIPGARFVAYPSGGHLLVGHQSQSTAAVVELLKATAGGDQVGVTRQ